MELAGTVFIHSDPSGDALLSGFVVDEDAATIAEVLRGLDCQAYCRNTTPGPKTVIMSPRGVADAIDLLCGMGYYVEDKR